MASIENLNSLQMTELEGLLKKCLEKRPDISSRVPEAKEHCGSTFWIWA